MPKIDKIFTLEVTPERFIQACSDCELEELNMLLEIEMRRRKLREASKPKLDLAQID